MLCFFRYLTTVTYSYWAIAYALSFHGAEKLLDGKPLGKMVAVDEYLPIMYNEHPIETWKDYFPNRNLIAFSATPLIVYPLFYTGDPGHVSDTENSPLIREEFQQCAEEEWGEMGEKY